VIGEDRGAVALVARLRREIDDDRALLARCLRDGQLARERLTATPDDPAALALAAVALHGWYTGLESILERIARQLDREVPEGDRWHRELLAQASAEIPRVRPPVLPREVVPELRELLSFRHFFRHAYGIVLDPVRIDANLVRLARIEPAVGAALDWFNAFLAAVADDESKPAP
jgi:hypothetical protein